MRRDAKTATPCLSPPSPNDHLRAVATLLARQAARAFLKNAATGHPATPSDLTPPAMPATDTAS